MNAPALSLVMLLATCSAMVGLRPASDARLHRLIRRPTRRRRRRRDEARQVRQAIQATDLLAVTLASGAPMPSAVAAIAAVVDDPARTVLARVSADLRMGATVALAWAPVAGEPAWAPVVTALVRASRSGAPSVAVLHAVAEDLRRDRLTRAEVAARAAGVRAVGPLAACFLPAFLLVGVVPVVVSLASDVLR